MRYFLLSLCIFLSSCATKPIDQSAKQSTPQRIDNCKFDSFEGTPIVFDSLPTILEQYGYSQFSFDHLDSTSKHPKSNYALMKAKVNPTIINGWASTTWRKVLVENCDVLYLPATFGFKQTSIEEMQKYSNFTLLTAIEENNKIIAALKQKQSQIWIGLNNATFIMTPTNEKITVLNYEKVTIVDATQDKNISAIQKLPVASIFILVKRNSGEIGYYPYLSNVTVQNDPFPKSWPAKYVDAIKNRSVIIGMTAEQAEMAWGKPKDINTTASSTSIRQQWVYSAGSYLYFTNGKLTTVQN